MKTIVLGVGNLLLGDEGVGIHVVRHLESESLPAQTDLVDGGTGGFHLLEYFEIYERIVLVDATMDGRPPGTVTVLEPRFSSEYPPSLSAHDIGLKDLIDAVYLLDKRPKIVLFAVSIAGAGSLGLSLTGDIEKVVPTAAGMIRDYLADHPL
jgi:hydrogenase maturation protease